MEERDIEMTPEDMKTYLDTHYFIQLALKVMNNISLKDETEQDYMKLWEKVSLEKKNTSIEYNPKLAQFYYNFLSTGYDNFGTKKKKKMIQDNPEYLVEAMIIFIEQLEENAKYIEQLEKQLKTEPEKQEKA